jgi:alanine-glyoxylate transaminase/serine-glyoxylate transaminase/serine-pyruvate transaminase
MLHEEGLAAVWDRHARHAEATRRAIRGWGLDVQCADPREYSASVTAVVLPRGHDADKVRQIILDTFDMSLGTGLGQLAGHVFRIGHLGHFNDLSLAGTLCGVEMGLELAGVPVERGGIAAALEYLRNSLRTS